MLCTATPSAWTDAACNAYEKLHSNVSSKRPRWLAFDAPPGQRPAHQAKSTTTYSPGGPVGFYTCMARACPGDSRCPRSWPSVCVLAKRRIVRKIWRCAAVHRLRRLVGSSAHCAPEWQCHEDGAAQFVQLARISPCHYRPDQRPKRLGRECRKPKAPRRRLVRRLCCLELFQVDGVFAIRVGRDLPAS